MSGRFCAAVAGISLACTIEPVAAGVLKNKADRAILAQSLAFREETVMLMALSRPGTSREVERKLGALGAVLRYVDRDVGYLRFVMATARVNDVAAIPELDALDFGMPMDRYNGTLAPTRSAASERSSGFAEPTRKFDPAEPARFPLTRMGSPHLLGQQMTFDGRGIVAAVIDGGVDILIPEMQRALTLDGKQRRKLLDVRTASDAVYSDNPLWVKTSARVTPRHGRFAADGRTFALPRAGHFRFGWLDERERDSIDLNRDGNPPGSSGLYGVLLDEANESVWVDTNQNDSFADEKELEEYRVRGDVGLFGVDRPQTPERETIPFAVQLDRSSHSVFINPLVGGHGTMTATTLAGAGPMLGLAPGAAIVLYNTPDATIYPWVESILEAERDRRVDLLCVSWGVFKLPIGADTLVAQVVDRAIERHGKPVFSGAANSGPTAGILAAPGISRLSYSIGGYTPRESLLTNAGIAADSEHGLPLYSARGPAHDGALKPDFIALTEVLSGDSGYRYSPRTGAGEQLPPGYAIGSGTSQATPSAAGAFALLMSAARQRGIRFDADLFRRALVMGAEFVPGYTVADQGNGLIRVDRAWEVLQRLREPHYEIAFEGTVDSLPGRALSAAGGGAGIWLREGWGLVPSRPLALSATRLSGPAGPLDFKLRIRDDDGTFHLEQERLALERGEPAEIAIAAAPREHGLHTGILEILAGDADEVIAQTFVGVINPIALVAGETTSMTGSFGYPAGDRHFLHVPPATAALVVEITCLAGEVATRIRGPGGIEAPVMDKDSWLLHERIALERDADRNHFHYVVENPTAGVWEVNLNRSAPLARDVERESSAAPLNRYAMQATALRYEVAVRPAEGLINARPVGSAARAQSHPELRLHRGAERNETFTFDHARHQHLMEVDVPEGTTALVGRVESTGNAAADFDLYFVEAPAGVHMPARAGDMIEQWRIVRAVRACDNSASKAPQIIQHQPAAGRWVLVIDRADDGEEAAVAQASLALLHPIYGSQLIKPLPRADVDGASGWSYGAALGAPTQAVPAPGHALTAYLQLSDAAWPLRILTTAQERGEGWKDVQGDYLQSTASRPVRIGFWRATQPRVSP